VGVGVLEPGQPVEAGAGAVVRLVRVVRVAQLGEHVRLQQPRLVRLPENDPPQVVAAAGLLDGVLDEAPRLEVEARPRAGAWQEPQQARHEPGRHRARQVAVVAGVLVGLVGEVAGEKLVPAVAAQRHRHVPAGELAQVVGGHHRRVGEGLVEGR
jgi:hypothetical protein